MNYETMTETELEAAYQAALDNTTGSLDVERLVAIRAARRRRRPTFNFGGIRWDLRKSWPENVIANRPTEETS